MNIIVIIIASLIVIAGALSRPTEIKNPEPVLGETSVVEETPTPTPTIIPTKIPTNTPEPIPVINQNLDSFQYPGSTIQTKSETALILESQSDAYAITDWYKEKIQAAGMNTKSFVTTKTNGNVKNVLVGANGETEIRVEITKKPGNSPTKIVVSIHSS